MNKLETPVSPVPIPDAMAGSRPLDAVRVLLVDDDQDTLGMLEALFVDAGALVQTVSSVAEGFAALRWFHPHVLISDIEMPHENGFDFLRRVRRLDGVDGGRVPAVALTAYLRADAAAAALDAGYCRFLQKPVNIAALIATVRELGARRA